MKSLCLFAALIGLGMSPVASAMKKCETPIISDTVKAAPFVLTPETIVGKMLFDYIGGKVDYPENAKQNHIHGAVQIVFNITEQDIVMQPVISKKAHPLLNNAIRNVIVRSPKELLRNIRKEFGNGPFALDINFSPANLDTTRTVHVLSAYPGGQEAFRSFLLENLKYPLIVKKEKIQGSVKVSMDVNEHGEISNPEVYQSPNPKLDEEALRIVNLIERLEPAKRYGQPFPSRLTFTIPCGLDLKSRMAGEKKQNEDKNVMANPEVKAEFPGGSQELLTYLIKNTRYPRAAIRKYANQTIRIIVQVVIDEEGKVTKPKIIESNCVESLFDREVLRVAQEMPYWTPAYHNGKPVKQKLFFPVTFRQ